MWGTWRQSFHYLLPNSHDNSKTSGGSPTFQIRKWIKAKRDQGLIFHKGVELEWRPGVSDIS